MTNFNSLEDVKKQIDLHPHKALSTFMSARSLLDDLAEKQEMEFYEYLKGFILDPIEGREDIRSRAITIHWLCQYQEPTLVDYFLSLLGDEQRKYLGVEGLKMTSKLEAFEPLVNLLAESEDPYDIMDVIDAILATEHPGVVKALEPCTSHEHPAVRHRAKAALRFIELRRQGKL